MNKAYSEGFTAHNKGLERHNNPYAAMSSMVEYYAWLAGFSDSEMGFKLSGAKF